MLAEEVVAGVTELALLELLRQRLQKTVVVASPAAGAEWVQVVPAGVAWELLLCTVVLATSAVVGNRSPRIRIADAGVTQVTDMGGATTAAASQTNRFNWSAGYGATNNAISLHAPFPSPPMVVGEKSTIGSATGSIDVGDQYSGVVLVVREWSIRAALLNIEWLKNHAR